MARRSDLSRIHVGDWVRAISNLDRLRTVRCGIVERGAETNAYPNDGDDRETYERPRARL